MDKFQGQEAPIVIYSMATSSPEEAPRGMEFLFSLDRLNVATSRARCACILVASPLLSQPECRTPRQMRLANAFRRYVELEQAEERALEPTLHRYAAEKKRRKENGAFVMLTENEVVQATTRFLEDNGYRVLQELSTTEKGRDIIAAKDDVH